MTFDLVIVDKLGNSYGYVEIEEDEHCQFMDIVKQLKLPLMSRMSDYYENVNFSPEEMSGLKDELEILQTHTERQNEILQRYISDLLKLVSEAKAMKTGLLGLAD